MRMEKPFIKGSSLPQREVTLEEKIRKRITPACVFKKRGYAIPVSKVEHVSKLKLEKGEYLCGDKQKWNTFFEGSAEISIPDENDIASFPKKIKGYANVDDNDDVEVISEISIYD